MILLMTEYRDSSSNNLLSLISGAFIGAAGLAWWLISEADKRKETKKQRAMMYSSRIQDGMDQRRLTQMKKLILLKEKN